MEKNAASIHLAPPPPAPTTRTASSSRRLSCSSVDSFKKGDGPMMSPKGRCDRATQDVLLLDDSDNTHHAHHTRHHDDGGSDDAAFTKPRRPGKVGRVLLPALAVLVLAWWVSSLVLPATRHRWYVSH